MKYIWITIFTLFSLHLFAQEICNNGLDDDANGLIDCADEKCICNICSNKQAAIWYFGNRAGLDFNHGTPIPLKDSEMNTSEGCASIADANGRLLFYTDGLTVWNNKHQVMPNGTGLLGNTSSSQSALIIPHPTNSSLYYIFTVDAADLVGVADGFRYSIVDLSLENGFGDISTKNELLLANTTEKVAAIKHCNNKDIWVVAHEWNSANFYVYQITENGLNTIPHIQTIGISHTGGSLSTGNMVGYLKFSVDGSRLAYAIRDTSMIEIFDFDTYTGLISNPIRLHDPDWGWTYGVEFSPNGQLLYASTMLSNARILQFDLTAGYAAGIKASEFVVATKSGFGTLQLASDQKIYIASYNSEKMAAIQAPNLYGANCQYQDSVLDLSPNKTILGLPNFIQSYFSDELPVCPNVPNVDICQGKVYMPNAFSPNGDGTNDFFRPTELNKKYILQFKIFNQWGQEVYNNEQPDGWDGTWLGVQQPMGVYLYLLQTQLPQGEVLLARGVLTLIR